MVLSLGSISYDYFVLHTNIKGANLGLHITSIVISLLCYLLSNIIVNTTKVNKYLKRKKSYVSGYDLLDIRDSIFKDRLNY